MNAQEAKDQQRVLLQDLFHLERRLATCQDLDERALLKGRYDQRRDLAFRLQAIVDGDETTEVTR